MSWATTDMAENKTRQTDASVDAYLAAIGNDTRRADCMALARLMAKVSKEAPKMWGSSIVGFGTYHYKYDSGREGDMCLVGFAARKGDISIYLTASVLAQDELMSRLGKHKAGKGCLYVSKLSDIDLQILDKLIAATVASLKAVTPAAKPSSC